MNYYLSLAALLPAAASASVIGVNAVFTAQKYDLIERAAQVVCDAILENYPKVQSVTVELKKPEAPINAVFDYVSVEMTRSRV